ncbi:cytosine permease [Providencia heimbachae]|uniref:Cytosine permease n=1 Tax=Providencia heimbachae ATCC 35613 TaxID=1354272 RepID=A0A1B7JW13_9GAMM|nr:cytosine permease [Providencia heimbachae]MDD9341731.1 cytosine permease [Providencia heimbachae]OAT52103.1 cytosine permease [Providencia heimbachae ATCC 35613]SQH15195.1 Cytosine permease [Providencia heimbachae]
MLNQEKENVLLDSEFEHTAVPLEHRKSFASVSAVWYSFPLVLTSAVIGGVVTAMLGFKMGVAAILTGNLLLCLIIGSLSYLAGATGENFAISAKRTFGQRGYVIVSGLLATVVIGWFALMVGLTGDIMFRSFGQNLLIMTLLGGVLYVAATFIGIKALAILGYIAAPLYVILGLTAVYFAMENGSSDIINYQPAIGAGVLSFGVAVTMIFSTFTDSGTMTADFTRWAKNGKQGFLAAFTAFPISKFFAEVIGAIIVATGVILHPEVTGGDFITILADAGPLFSVLAIILVFVNLGVGCTHCLYNGAVGWSHITNGKMRTLTIILGVIGIIVALTGVWNAFQTWLNLLGLIVPPIAAIIIMDQLILKRKHDESKKWQPLAFTSWILASCIALVVNAYTPYLSVVVAGLVSSSIIYFIGHQICKNK